MTETTIALAGNPNCGKTTLFNALTGSRQQVGNWPGVTVERIEGRYSHDGMDVRVIDLPGIYSFSTYSMDETISREYILREKPAVVVNIVDATNLERNLYLTTQLLEMKVPIVVVLNMMDLAKQRRVRIEVEHLARHLGCPVVPTVVSRGQGVSELREVIAAAIRSPEISAAHVEYDSEAEKAIEAIRAEVASAASANGVDDRWLAVKLLEGDELATELADHRADEIVSTQIDRVQKHIGEDMDIVIADGRYGFIHGLSRDVIHREDQVRRTVTDITDRIVLNRILGIPIFLGIMYLIFMITINVGGPFIDFFDGLCGTIFVDGFRELLGWFGSPELLTALLADGLGGGIQTVATFIPPIFFIFLCLSILEDSGYMARAAFVMDRLLHAIGLPGKAFLPMLVGFGCNVPAILATRTLESNRDRIMTIMMNPFMSCGARLPVYALFTVAFFGSGGSFVVFSLYMIGIVLAILTGLVLKRTVLKGEPSTFVMELPPYHVPTFGGIMYHTWNKLKSFILRAGKVIIVVVIILSLLNSLGTDGSFGNEDSESSVLSAIGKTITPVFGPMGISDDNWPATVGLFTGIFAKEAVVGTLDSLYSQQAKMEEQSEQEHQEDFDFWGGVAAAFKAIPDGLGNLGTSMIDIEGAEEDLEVADKASLVMHERFGGKPAAYAYMLFVLIYVPCVAAIAAIYRETNIKWATFSVLYLTGLAWIIATAFYQTATLKAHPSGSLMWLGICAAALIVFYFAMKLRGRTMTVKA